MKPDPLIDEIREVRHRISEECGHDPKRLVDRYLDVQRRLKESGHFRFIPAPGAIEPEPAALRETPENQ